MNTQELIDKLTKAISFKYKTDKTAPGLTVAALKKGYYCSVVRYEGAFGVGKQVVCKAKADTLDGALAEVANQFLKTMPSKTVDPIDELTNLIKK